MMRSVKEMLHNAIDLLNEEARQILEFVQGLQSRKRRALTLRRLANDPAFKVPSEESLPFGVVDAVQGKGIAASRLLMESRR